MKYFKWMLLLLLLSNQAYSLDVAFYDQQSGRHPMTTYKGDWCERGSKAGWDYYLYNYDFPTNTAHSQAVVNGIYAWEEWVDINPKLFSSTKNPAFSNGRTEIHVIGYTPSIKGIGTGTIAFVYQESEYALSLSGWKCWLEESDMIFIDDATRDFITGRYDTNDLFTASAFGLYAWELVAMHEFGHTLGIDDDTKSNRYSLMHGVHPSRTFIGNGNLLNIGSKAIDRGVKVYGAKNFSRDISPISIKYVESSSGDWIPEPLTVETLNTGYRTMTVNIEFGLENNSHYLESSVHIGFYLSDNPIISTSDTLVASIDDWIYLGLSEYKIGKAGPITLNFPGPGTYYLGYYVDYDNYMYEGKNDGYLANGQMLKEIYVPY